jgi:hypothetical protein
MAACVLAASSAFPWLFGDVASPAGDALLDLINRQGAVVPALWFTEIENGFGMAERRNRLSSEAVRQAGALLCGLPLVSDELTPERAFGALLSLSS